MFVLFFFLFFFLVFIFLFIPALNPLAQISGEPFGLSSLSAWLTWLLTAAPHQIHGFPQTEHSRGRLLQVAFGCEGHWPHCVSFQPHSN
jgi:hypothetical protein